MSYMSKHELSQFGFKSLGENVLVSNHARIYEPHLISIGDNSRIDDLCILNGTITIGRNVHVAVQSNLAAGRSSISIGDYSGISYGVQIITQIDDYSGLTLSNPTVSGEFKKTISRPISIGRHVKIGTYAIILPGSVIGDICSISSRSNVSGNLEPKGLYKGDPAVRISELSDRLLDLEQQYENGNK